MNNSRSINKNLFVTLLAVEAIKRAYASTARKALSVLPQPEEPVYKYDGRLISLPRLKSLSEFCTRMAGLERDEKITYFGRLDAHVVATRKFNVEGLHKLVHAVKARMPTHSYWNAVQELFYISFKHDLELCDIVKVIETYGVINTICILRRGKK